MCMGAKKKKIEKILSKNFTVSLWRNNKVDKIKHVQTQKHVRCVYFGTQDYFFSFYLYSKKDLCIYIYICWSYENTVGCRQENEIAIANGMRYFMNS